QVWQGILAAILEAICIAMLVSLAQGDRATPLDRAIGDWVDAHRTTAIDTLAALANIPGTFPAAAALTFLMVAAQWYWGRSWRESAVIVWSLAASEGIGLVLLGLLRSRAIEPAKVE